MTMTPAWSEAKRIVIKVGSALVTHQENGQPCTDWMATLAADIAALRKAGKQVILVCSGSVSLGCNLLNISRESSLELDEKQAAAACGQVAMMDAWKAQFATYHYTVAQLLLTLDTSESRRRYINARNTLNKLLKLGAMPIVNENDTIATTSLRIGDNDRLAARVAEMAGADMLLILSDINGFYTADPNTDPDAKLIPIVETLTPEIEAMAGAANSAVGTGGMVTKLMAVQIAQAAGCHTWIGAGRPLHPIRQLQQEGGGTWFLAHDDPASARKLWIGGSVRPTGVLVVDVGAEKALYDGNSLLPVGVVSIKGNFEKGDAVRIHNQQGQVLGTGLIGYDADEARLIMGHKSEEFERLIGYKGKSSLIHRDDMALHPMP